MSEVTIDRDAIEAWLPYLREDIGLKPNETLSFDYLNDLTSAAFENLISSANDNHIFQFDRKGSDKFFIISYTTNLGERILGLKTVRYGIDASEFELVNKPIMKDGFGFKDKIDEELIVSILNEVAKDVSPLVYVAFVTEQGFDMLKNEPAIGMNF